MKTYTWAEYLYISYGGSFIFYHEDMSYVQKNFEQEGGGENLDEVWTMWGKTHRARSF